MLAERQAVLFGFRCLVLHKKEESGCRVHGWNSGKLSQGMGKQATAVFRSVYTKKDQGRQAKILFAPMDFFAVMQGALLRPL